MLLLHASNSLLGVHLPTSSYIVCAQELNGPSSMAQAVNLSLERATHKERKTYGH